MHTIPGTASLCSGATVSLLRPLCGGSDGRGALVTFLHFIYRFDYLLHPLCIELNKLFFLCVCVSPNVLLSVLSLSLPSPSYHDP